MSTRITVVSAIDGKAATRTFHNDAAANEAWNAITNNGGFTLYAVWLDRGTIKAQFHRAPTSLLSVTSEAA